MSLVDVIVQPDAAYMITDSGVFNAESGIVVGLESKVFSIPEHRLAFSVMGAVGSIFPSVARVVQKVAGTGMTLDRFQHIVRMAYHIADMDPENYPSRWFAIQHCAEKGRAIGRVFFVNQGGGNPGQQPWEWYPITATMHPSAPQAGLFGKVVEKFIHEGKAFRARDAMKLVSAQREARGHGIDARIVAGEIWLTKVSAAGVTQRRIHTFPDRIGALAGAEQCPVLN